jgi:hypothetical protein
MRRCIDWIHYIGIGVGILGWHGEAFRIFGFLNIAMMVRIRCLDRRECIHEEFFLSGLL